MARKLYVMQTTRHDATAHFRAFYAYMLHEMTPREFAQVQAEAAQANKTPHEPAIRVWFDQYSGSQAHRYVRDGGVHATGLWFDGDRIRYAPSDPGA